jgi:hypothetical protein
VDDWGEFGGTKTGDEGLGLAFMRALAVLLLFFVPGRAACRADVAAHARPGPCSGRANVGEFRKIHHPRNVEV